MNRLRNIPKVDEILKNPQITTRHTALIRETLDEIRSQLMADQEVDISIDSIVGRVLQKHARSNEPSLKRLLNATGVVVHTNLGRSVIDKALLDEIAPILTGYSNLEFDLATGKRGSRYTHITAQISKLIGAEDALVVNNNASAVFLILNTFAAGKEAVVSRGELVEIGGSFRIPEVMRASGAVLHEIGTTNKTHLADYQNAIGENTAVLMKVHRSNFTLRGFTSEVEFDEIASLAQKNSLIDYFDLGSGQMVDLGVGNDPLLSELKNASLVSFSGDKLFGGVQAGIIFGKKALIEKLKKNQLLRMLRVDKFTLGVLEATMRRYQNGALDEIPTVQMIRADQEVLEARARKLVELIGISLPIAQTRNFVGGGALPEESIDGVAVVIERDAEALQEALRHKGLIARVESSKLLIETRTLFDDDLKLVAELIREVL